MDNALSKLYAMLDYFKLTGTMSGKQEDGEKTVSIFAQSPLFDIGFHINSKYVVVRAFDRFEHNQFIHTVLYLDEVDEGIALITELLEEHTHNTL